MLFFCGLLLFTVCIILLFFIGASEYYVYDNVGQAYIIFLAFGAFTGFLCCAVDMIITNLMLKVG